MWMDLVAQSGGAIRASIAARRRPPRSIELWMQAYAVKHVRAWPRRPPRSGRKSARCRVLVAMTIRSVPGLDRRDDWRKSRHVATEVESARARYGSCRPTQYRLVLTIWRCRHEPGPSWRTTSDEGQDCGRHRHGYASCRASRAGVPRPVGNLSPTGSGALVTG